MGKWKSGINWAVVVLLLVSSVLSIWVSFERKMLNQQYERVIERYESELDSLGVLNQDIRHTVNLLKNLADRQEN